MATSECTPVRESPQLILPEGFPHSKGAIHKPRQRNKEKKQRQRSSRGCPTLPRVLSRRVGLLTSNRNHHWQASNKADEWLGSIPPCRKAIFQDFPYKPFHWNGLQPDRAPLARKPNGCRALRRGYPEKNPNLPSRTLGAVITI